MRRITEVQLVGIPLRRAVLCPNDDTIYDADRWKDCPTCQSGDRIYLSRYLGVVRSQEPALRKAAVYH